MSGGGVISDDFNEAEDTERTLTLIPESAYDINASSQDSRTKEMEMLRGTFISKIQLFRKYDNNVRILRSSELSIYI